MNARTRRACVRALPAWYAILGALGVLLVVACGGEEPAPEPSPTIAPTATLAPAPTIAPTATLAPAPTIAPAPTPPPAVVVALNDSRGRGPFAFEPAELTFDAGELVSLTLISESQFHTFTVEELGVDVSVNGGETVSVSFTFDERGTYELICIPHQALGMKGTITVQ